MGIQYFNRGGYRLTILCVRFTNWATVGRLEQVQLCNRLIDQSADNITGLKCAKECLILKYKYIQNPCFYSLNEWPNDFPCIILSISRQWALILLLSAYRILVCFTDPFSASFFTPAEPLGFQQQNKSYPPFSDWGGSRSLWSDEFTYYFDLYTEVYDYKKGLS